MELHEAITKRKSIRKYKMEPLPKEKLHEVVAFSKTLKPLLPGIRTDMGIADGGVGLFAVKAPHYLAFYSEEKSGSSLNAGFMLQQMDLFLSSAGLGSCWLGMAKPSDKAKNGLDFVIMLAFGAPGEPLHRKNLSEFKRRSLAEISKGADPRLEGARLAPSATNAQPWYFTAEGGKLTAYRKKLNPVKAAVYKRLNQIDLGIALCHIDVESERLGLPFNFSPNFEEAGGDVSGYVPVGVVL